MRFPSFARLFLPARRQGHDESGGAPVAFAADGSLVLPDDGLGDGQPQAEAPLGAAAVGPVEPVEQMGQHLRRNRRPAVFKRGLY